MPKKQPQSSTPVQLLRRVGEGTLLALTVTFALLLFCAWLTSMGLLGRQSSLRCCLLCALAGTLAGGLLSLRGGRLPKLPLALGVGGGQLLVLLLLGAALNRRPPVGVRLAEVGLACFCGGGMAALLCPGRKPRRRR